MIIWKYFSIQTHNPSALWILQGDNKWELEKEEEREGNKVLPVKGFVAMRGWRSMNSVVFSSLYCVK